MQMLAIASKSEYNEEKGGNTMANTSAVYARIDTNLKDNAERVKWPKKIGRNELCPCGSGKKYKRCHGR